MTAPLAAPVVNWATTPLVPGAGDGVVLGLPDDLYHGHPGSLSSSGARLLLPPSCPARYLWEQEHGETPKRAWDLGTAAHQRVLGVGPDLAVVMGGTKDGPTGPAVDYRTAYAKEHRDEIRARGAVPVLAAELETVDAMAAALREHPIARILFDPDLGGSPEVSLFWTDPEWDVLRRARLDWLPPVRSSGRLIVPDYKSAISADRGAFNRAVQNFGYHVQDCWYTDLVRALVVDDVAFVFVVQEKTPPFLVNVFELDAGWWQIGRIDVDRALGVFAECRATGEWPSYSSEVERLSPPVWLARQYDGAGL